MAENDQVQQITRGFLKEFVPRNIPAEAPFVDTVCDEYFKFAALPAGSNKKHSFGLEFIDPALATFITPILAQVLASATKSLVDNLLARKAKHVDEKDVRKAFGKLKELSPELIVTLTSEFAKYINEHSAPVPAK